MGMFLSTLDVNFSIDERPGSEMRQSIIAPRVIISHDRELRAWAQRRGGRVLVVDDSAVERVVTASALAKAGFKVLMAADGREGVDMVRDSALPFDLVVMDMSMPEVDGLAAARAIRALPAPRSRVPIIALTANDGPGDRDACLGAGMDAYVSKPLSLPVLLRKMYLHLAGTGARSGAMSY